MSMDSAHARLDFINSMESAQDNLLALLGKLGTDFSVLLFNAHQEPSGTVQSVQLQETTAQLEPSSMAQNAQQISQIAQRALLGQEQHAKLLEIAKMECIS